MSLINLWNVNSISCRLEIYIFSNTNLKWIRFSNFKISFLVLEDKCRVSSEMNKVKDYKCLIFETTPSIYESNSPINEL